MLGANAGTRNGRANGKTSDADPRAGEPSRQAPPRRSQGRLPFAKPHALRHVGHYSRHLQKQA
jgi:hypothetical protein